MITAMQAGKLGLIDTPLQYNASANLAAHESGVPWCADNGAFSNRFNEKQWWAFLKKNVHRAGTCVFAVAPDVVGDATATLARSAPWLPRIRALGYPAAFVAQDGQESLPMPWREFDVLFIGGSTEWKLGPHARTLAAEAKMRGKRVHMGRVNSKRRYQYAKKIGCDSCDGTFLTFAPKTNLPRLLKWFPNMTFILGIDPGNIESGWAIIDRETRRPLQFAKSTNEDLLQMILTGDFSLVDIVGIEMIASFGMPVGVEVFETCVWIGRFEQALLQAHSIRAERVTRKEVVLHICHSPKAGDPNVKQALVDRFAPGVSNHGKGRKADPGWFYGFAGSDVWSAYSVAIYFSDQAVLTSCPTPSTAPAPAGST